MEFLSIQEKMNYDEGLRVLLVDQDTTSLMYMSSVLEEHSYRVTTSKSAFIALSMILERRIKFDLIITDIEMPDMDGFEFLKQITTRCDIPILLTSASEEVEVTKKALEEGACFFFHKPIAPHNLVNIWQHILRYRMERDQLSKGFNPREVEKYYEALHGKGKSSLINLVEKDNNNNNNIGRNLQLGKRAREDHGKITSSSSASSSLADKKKDKKKDKQKEKSLRLYWTVKLQEKFKEAYEALGETRATPSRIKELMNEPQITPQHISSYLQKFRARIKSRNEQAATTMHNPMLMPQRYLHNFPPSMNPSGAPHQYNNSLNSTRPNYGHIPTPPNLVPNSSLANFNAGTSIIGSVNPRPNIQGNIFPGLHPLTGSMPTPHAINPWQTTLGAPNMVCFQNDFGVGKHITGQNPQVLQEMNNVLGMGGGNIGATEFVTQANGVAQVQAQNGGLGINDSGVDMTQELTEDDIKTIMQRFSQEDSTNDASSSGGNVSFCSVIQPLTPPVGGEFVDDDMEGFLALLELPPNSDDSFITP